MFGGQSTQRVLSLLFHPAIQSSKSIQNSSSQANLEDLKVVGKSLKSFILGLPK